MGEIAATTICQGLPLLPLTPLSPPLMQLSMGIAGQDMEPCAPRCRGRCGGEGRGRKEGLRAGLPQDFGGTLCHPGMAE